MTKSELNMKKTTTISTESGGVLIMVTLLLVVLLGTAAFAIDISHLLIVRNELKNAADAGSLAGARVLYSSVSGTRLVINDGSWGMPSAKEVAYAAATANGSDGSPVEVQTYEKGHWCFTCNGNKGAFIANDLVSAYPLTSLSFSDLDNDTNYINAVRVVTSRGPGTRAASFIAGIFGFGGFSLSAESVAWRGFTGSSFKVDLPIAICKESVYNADGSLNCDEAKLQNEDNENAMWTNLEQGTNPPSTNAASVGELICNAPKIAEYSVEAGAISTTNGTIMDSFNGLYECWPSNTEPWKVTLPLIECESETSSSTSNPVVGALNVEILWFVVNGHTQGSVAFDEVPTSYNDSRYAGYSSTETDPAVRKQRWADFLNLFKGEHDPALTVEQAADLYQQKTIYFKPSCEVTQAGKSGGAPSNVFGEIPRLVR